MCSTGTRTQAKGPAPLWNSQVGQALSPANSFWSSMLALLLALPACAETVQIGVFSLFRPAELRVSPVSSAVLVTSGDQRAILEGHQARTVSLARIAGPVRVSAPDGSDADFQLSIPGKIERQFHGVLTIRPGDHKLIVVLSMGLEIAVASVVAAEMPASTPIEALKAQAVAARSYYAASPARHDDFKFCDTTHCQFLREWPGPASAAYVATRDTRDYLLTYQGKPFAAQYSAACGGQTRSLEPVDSQYPYYSVPCEFCRRHSPGVVEGHQLGLCQRGAAGMAAAGSGFREILEHYFPATALIQNSPNATFLLPLHPALRHSRD